MDLEWIGSTMIAAIIPTMIVYVAWRNHSTRPISARLFIAAAICQFLLLGVYTAQQFSGASGLFEIQSESEPENFDLTMGDELLPLSSRWRQMIVEQMALSSFHIVSWSLMAWAILMRPDDHPRKALASS
jgi:hypothetical protein